MSEPDVRLLAYQVQELQKTVGGLTEKVEALGTEIAKQGAARGALLGAAGILGAVMAFIANILVGLFNR